MSHVGRTGRATAVTLEPRFHTSRVLLLLLLTIVWATALAGTATAAEVVFPHYRGVTLGDSVPLVANHLKAALSDVVVVHERPTLVQRLTWRPRRFVSGMTIEPDALAEMVLTFHLGRRARIDVTYDRDRTAGMTNADLYASLSSTYGTSMLPSTRVRTPSAAPAEPEPIGRWGDADTLVMLDREPYSSRVRLTITSIAADSAMQQAIVDGTRLDASEAPARDLARRGPAAEAVRRRDEIVRRDNTATFTP